ncbi:hypothetical protein KIH87_05615 [Paraneptunicella aestuarii]|uniref:hypothetical protein n=1 Tax=Paraneptunicella aestuarii TaxID=2831148 RepID=UPI001E5D01A3|nr:hypothetical protein [Paraneptunicella aestuarii]UAA39832.1 hypothetical protein KIH87_05615 [Paraneptunicella aestuarii]
MIQMVSKKFSPGFVPQSVYERAVVWYLEIQEMPEEQRIIEMNRWSKFIADLPRKKQRLRILSKG